MHQLMENSYIQCLFAALLHKLLIYKKDRISEVERLVTTKTTKTKVIWLKAESMANAASW